MYKVGDKFDIKYIDDFFCEIIGLIPGGQSQKETVYILSFAGTKFNLPESVFEVLFEKKEGKRMSLDLDNVFKDDDIENLVDIEEEQVNITGITDAPRRGRPRKEKED